MARPTYDPDSLLVGIVGKPHGLDGEMTLRAYNTRGADLAQVPDLIFEQGDSRQVRRLRTARRRADGWLVRVEGVESRDQAASLTHAAVRVHKRALPALGPGEFFVEDLLGCRVRTVEGQPLGAVDSIFWNGAQDVMSVLSDATGPGESLIPLVPQFLHLVDTAAREIVVAWDAPAAGDGDDRDPDSGQGEASHE